MNVKTISHSLLLLLCGLTLTAQSGWQKTGAGSRITEITSTSSDAANGTSATNTLLEQGFAPNLSATSRFLGQATLGADHELIIATAAKGKKVWLEEQFNEPITLSIEQFTRDLTQSAYDSTAAIGGDISNIQPLLRYWHYGWWQYTMTGKDLLRNRVALALSEIFVISELPELQKVPLSLANYYDMLLKNTFGNFRDLLYDVTLHPAMGFYLTHLNNPKTNLETNQFPDENYAREVMQLFTIGLYELNPDGSQKLDTNNEPIPTYDNEDIIEFSKVFTGLTWGDHDKFGKKNPPSEDSFTVPMIMFDDSHEGGSKTLLNGSVIADRTPVDGLADINDGLDNLFNHPNVGPFIGKLLIQRLVTANPSPAYIARVTAAFNNNGNNVRGDMKAVIRAILLDEEAASCPAENEALDGMLREPIVRYTQLSRAFNAVSPSGLYRNTMNDFNEQLFQRPLGSPSVFNFFQQDFQPMGAIQENNLVAPVFQITNSVSTVGYANRLHTWLFEDDLMEYQDIYKDEPNLEAFKNSFLDLTDEFALQDDLNIGALIERLNLILAHGMMTDTTRAIITNALQEIPETRVEYRVKMALFLTMISPDYLIFR